jgi:hypothetical protein
MRVYHFLPAKHALDDLEKRRIKLSELDQLNDPFELWCVSQEDPLLRESMRAFKDDMSKHYAILCNSKRWHNPLLWSHYADKHRGICLGLEIDECRGRSVRYVKDRPRLSGPPTVAFMQELLFTKYQDWQYEEEWRDWFRVDTRDSSGYYFYTFDEHVKPYDVITGPLCNVSADTIREALKGHREYPIRVVRTLLAPDSFQVVEGIQLYGLQAPNSLITC